MTLFVTCFASIPWGRPRQHASSTTKTENAFWKTYNLQDKKWNVLMLQKKVVALLHTTFTQEYSSRSNSWATLLSYRGRKFFSNHYQLSDFFRICKKNVTMSLMLFFSSRQLRASFWKTKRCFFCNAHVPEKKLKNSENWKYLQYHEKIHFIFCKYSIKGSGWKEMKNHNVIFFSHDKQQKCQCLFLSALWQ